MQLRIMQSFTLSEFILLWVEISLCNPLAKQEPRLRTRYLEEVPLLTPVVDGASTKLSIVTASSFSICRIGSALLSAYECYHKLLHSSKFWLNRVTLAAEMPFMISFRAFQKWTVRYLPWQALYPLPMIGRPKPRKGLYAKIFSHLRRRKHNERYHRMLRATGFIDLWNSTGSSNRPTLTGEKELIIFHGGKVRVGDMVLLVDVGLWYGLGKRGWGRFGVNINKRIVALPGDEYDRKGIARLLFGHTGTVRSI